MGGASKLDVTPPPGMPMAGYAVERRGSETLDSLCARALVLKGRSGGVFPAVLDAVRVDFELYQEVREAVARVVGCSSSSVIVAATHTHASPEVSLDPWSTLELSPEDYKAVEWYGRELAYRASRAALRAAEEAERCSVAVSEAHVEGVASSRIDPSRPVDSRAYSAWLWSEGKLKAVLAVYACHPTVLGPLKHPVLR